MLSTGAMEVLPLPLVHLYIFFFFFSRRRGHTRCYRDWSSDVCSSDLDGEPADMLCQPVDSYSAALAVIAIQSALFALEQTGRGQQVDIALVEGGTAFVNAQVPDYFRNKKVRKRGFPSIGNLRCKDGKYLSSAAFAQAHFWAPFCDAVGLPEMRDRVPAGNEEMIRKVKA